MSDTRETALGRDTALPELCPDFLRFRPEPLVHVCLAFRIERGCSSRAIFRFFRFSAVIERAMPTGKRKSRKKRQPAAKPEVFSHGSLQFDGSGKSLERPYRALPDACSSC